MTSAMRTGTTCLRSTGLCSSQKRRRSRVNEIVVTKSRKKSRIDDAKHGNYNWFDSLHDDLVISILMCLSSIASSPADLINATLTCKRFCSMLWHPLVLVKASTSALKVKAALWSDSAHKFLKLCAEAGNVEACYTLGMIRFYCLRNTPGGASLMAKAALASHAAALHSLAVIQFNGSGGTRKDKEMKAGVALCARAASLGYIDAMRELGHCLQDGYGVVKNVLEGRRFLFEANAREAAAALGTSPHETALHLKLCLHYQLHSRPPNIDESTLKNAVQQKGIATGYWPEDNPIYKLIRSRGNSLLSDFGCNVPPTNIHIANRFLVDWFTLYPPPSGLRLCSYANCGRPETRRHEFRRCSACGKVNYCSRACQAVDWRIGHKHDCQPIVDGEDDLDDEDNPDEVDGDEDSVAVTEDLGDL